ncbi:DUF262 domain-containing protein [Nostoc sp. CHAB 5834]|nr:DUF262 domain-containing protein [Nostoc sp. CHAB 5834]
MTKIFQRYDDAEGANPEIAMPRTQIDARVSNICISEVLGRLESFTKNEKGHAASAYPWASRFVMGFPLPSWQRPPSWTTEQQVRFIESIWAGVDLGSYMVNDLFEYVRGGKAGDIEYRENSEVLLDGQQRLSAIEAYVCNQIAVPDAQGVPRYWRELGRVERRRFSAFHFARANVQSWDEKELRWVYDLRAFGGTPHTEDQRASTSLDRGAL